jgi:hypothetical protein
VEGIFDWRQSNSWEQLFRLHLHDPSVQSGGLSLGRSGCDIRQRSSTYWYSWRQVQHPVVVATVVCNRADHSGLESPDFRVGVGAVLGVEARRNSKFREEEGLFFFNGVFILSLSCDLLIQVVLFCD